ncbi:MAG: hypothetical protein DRG09_03585 [Epsilonproteobacteria bacterium]|nr:MAG: hypothetical protein DRG09_03585 [Campylobacterota bacterium]
MKNKTNTLAGIALSITLSILGLTSTASAQLKDVPKAEQLPTKNEMVLAYYGRPGVKSMGILGQHSIASLIPIIKAKTAEYKKASGNQNIVPGFDVIYGMAAGDPGRDKDYIINISEKKLMTYINAGQKHGLVVFIDTQLGKMSPIEAIRPLLKYLKYDNVHLAIDPEFEVKNLNVRPGKKIGHISGSQVNQVQKAMTDYMKQHGIKGKKMLIIHMFRHTMLSNKSDLKTYDNIDMIFNLDGHGSPRLKVDIYNGIYKHRTANKVAGGFKLFFDEDKPRLMTAKEVLGLKSVSGVKMKEMPKFINYQ